MSASSVILEKVVPAMGALISTVMYASPLPSVHKASSTKMLGDLNPVPFSITIANTIIWLSYGLLKKDPFITFPNTPGVLLAVYATMTTFSLADEVQKQRLRNILCLQAALLPALGVITAFFCADLQAQQALWGLAGNGICLVYYGAPLSTMGEVIKTKNSSSILLPLTVTNLLNALLWTCYGAAIADVYVWLPNGIGAVLSLAQVALAFMYPASKTNKDHQHRSDDDETEPLRKYDDLE